MLKLTRYRRSIFLLILIGSVFWLGLSWSVGNSCDKDNEYAIERGEMEEDEVEYTPYTEEGEEYEIPLPQQLIHADYERATEESSPTPPPPSTHLNSSSNSTSSFVSTCPQELHCTLEYDIRIITVDRPDRDTLILNTLLSWMLTDGGATTDSIHIYPGSGSAAHLGPFLPLKDRLYIHPIDLDELKKVPDHRTARKATYNYYRALNDEHRIPRNKFKYTIPVLANRRGMQEGKGCTCDEMGVPGGVLLLEDDVLFSRNFLSILVDTLHEIVTRYPKPPAILSMYVPNYHKRSIPRGKFYWNKGFCCTQVMYFTDDALPASRRVLEADWGNGALFGQPYDLALKNLHRNGTVRIYRTTKPVVQHTGAGKSTGLGRKHHNGKFDINL
ncbi:hypothetical protein QOT17_003068 [Balamuthia mandrillaris]